MCVRLSPVPPRFALVRSFTSLPQYVRFVVPARQAYSHSASVGNRYMRPSFADNHRQNNCASCHKIGWTGSIVAIGNQLVLRAMMLVLRVVLIVLLVRDIKRREVVRLGQRHPMPHVHRPANGMRGPTAFDVLRVQPHHKRPRLDPHQLHPDRIDRVGNVRAPDSTGVATCTSTDSLDHATGVFGQLDQSTGGKSCIDGTKCHCLRHQ